VTQAVGAGLNSGQSTSVTVVTPPGGNCFDPDCTVTVEVDSSNWVNECKEDNNRSGWRNRSSRHSPGTRRRAIWCATMMAPMGRPSQVGSGRWGFRDRPISPRSPWQNPYVERLIGTLRRDCLDHVVIFGERHLRRVLTLYSPYYNETRTHLGLGKDAPLGRAVQRSGTIVTTPILSGLHHRYARI